MLGGESLALKVLSLALGMCLIFGGLGGLLDLLLGDTVSL